MASKFLEKYREFMANRNGPDQLARDALVVALVFFVPAVVFGDIRIVFLVLGAAAMGYSYFRLFSRNTSARAAENRAYLAKKSSLLGRVTAPFKKASAEGKKAAEQAKDKEHRYFSCPKCGQAVRVPRGAGKIRVTCPKCGEKFEKKA